MGLGPELIEFQRARLRWEREGPSNYAMTVHRWCFCLQEATGSVVVVVRDGLVRSRAYTQTGEPVDARFASAFPGVEGLFEVIFDAARQRPAALAVRYDPALGYPVRIDIDHHARYVDDEVTFAVSEFEAY